MPQLFLLYWFPVSVGVCVCVRARVLKTGQRHRTFGAVLSYRLSNWGFIASCGVRLHFSALAGRPWDPTLLLSSEVWCCLQGEIIAKVQNV